MNEWWISIYLIIKYITFALEEFTVLKSGDKNMQWRNAWLAQ